MHDDDGRYVTTLLPSRYGVCAVDLARLVSLVHIITGISVFEALENVKRESSRFLSLLSFAGRSTHAQLPKINTCHHRSHEEAPFDAFAASCLTNV